MARYTTTIDSPWSPKEAFRYMADVNNFAAWDPGVKSVDQVAGDGPGPDAVYDVKLAVMTLQYETTTYSPDVEAVVEAQSALLSSHDTITITETSSGCRVTYDAVVKLKGLLGLADPLFKLVFDRIGDKATAGLKDALDGTKVRP